jgi:hypothetical protein
LKGPIDELAPGFRVVEFAPRKKRNLWTYATVCLSRREDPNPIELHLFSDEQSEDEVVEILYAVAHFHQNSTPLNLGHTVNFGKPWRGQSKCDHGLISLPYLDGPSLENLRIDERLLIKCYWLIPITQAEVDYKKAAGLEALEKLFEEKNFNYADPRRRSVC